MKGIRSSLLHGLIILIAVSGPSFSDQQSTESAASEPKEAAVAPPAGKVPVSIPDVTYFVKQEDSGGAGSAFLLEDDDGVWLVSNCHVFSGSTNFTIINIQGNIIEVPSRIEVAKDRDIIRFRTDEPRGLPLSPTCMQGEKIIVYGDSGGAGVLTRLEGKAMALGPDRIEISAKIIPGNSGGPVVNVDKEVLGVSTYMFRDELPDWIADGTRFSETRRMALRLNDIEWIPVELSEFYRQTVCLAEVEEVLYTAIYIADVLSRNNRAFINASTDSHQLDSWLKKHNKLAKRNSRSSIKDAEYNMRRLVRIMDDLAEEPSPDCEITIPYLKDQLTDMQEVFEAIRDLVEDISE